MSQKVLFLFGPNLGTLGRRDPELYGSQTLEEIMRAVAEGPAAADVEVSWSQSDHEGELVQRLLAAKGDGFDDVVLNAGALSHYSYALRDAVEACELPVIEVHQTNI